MGESAWEKKRASLLETLKKIAGDDDLLKMILDEAYLFGLTVKGPPR